MFQTQKTCKAGPEKIKVTHMHDTHARLRASCELRRAPKLTIARLTRALWLPGYFNLTNVRKLQMTPSMALPKEMPDMKKAEQSAARTFRTDPAAIQYARRFRKVKKPTGKYRNIQEREEATPSCTRNARGWCIDLTNLCELRDSCLLCRAPPGPPHPICLLVDL